MCNIDRKAEARLLAMGINLISKLIDSELRADRPTKSANVLETATTAYSQGKITKHQYIAVINALDEMPTTVETKAYAQQEYGAIEKVSSFLSMFE